MIKLPWEDFKIHFTPMQMTYLYQNPEYTVFVNSRSTIIMAYVSNSSDISDFETNYKNDAKAAGSSTILDYHGSPIVSNRGIKGTLWSTALNFQLSSTVVDNNFYTINLYDALGDLCNNTPSDAVKSVIDFVPSTYNYDLYGGRFMIIDIGTGAEVKLSCIGIPDVPAGYGGNKVFVANLRFCEKVWEYCIRASNPTYLQYNKGGLTTQYGWHTNELRIVITYDQGVTYHCSFIPEIYRDYESEG